MYGRCPALIVVLPSPGDEQLWLDWRCIPPRPGLHLTNVMLHAACVLLVFFIALRMGARLSLRRLGRAFILVWAGHNEPVSWIARPQRSAAGDRHRLTLWATTKLVQQPPDGNCYLAYCSSAWPWPCLPRIRRCSSSALFHPLISQHQALGPRRLTLILVGIGVVFLGYLTLRALALKATFLQLDRSIRAELERIAAPAGIAVQAHVGLDLSAWLPCRPILWSRRPTS